MVRKWKVLEIEKREERILISTIKKEASEKRRSLHNDKLEQQSFQE